MYRPDCPSTAIGPLRETFGARQQKIFFVHPIDSALAAEPGRNKIASHHVCPEDMGLLRRSGRVDLPRMTTMLISRAGKCQVKHYINMFAE